METHRVSAHSTEAPSGSAQPWPCRSEGFAEDLDPSPPARATTRSVQWTRPRRRTPAAALAASLAVGVGLVVLFALV